MTESVSEHHTYKPQGFYSLTPPLRSVDAALLRILLLLL